LLQTGYKLSFNLGELFPNLSYPIVTVLDKCYLDPLYNAQQQIKPNILGDNATIDFILLHVFEIVPELINEPSDLLRVLMRRHYSNQNVPDIIDQRLIQILCKNDQFNDWPLGEIIHNRKAFFSFPPSTLI
jgi:hypothetical protein